MNLAKVFGYLLENIFSGLIQVQASMKWVEQWVEEAEWAKKQLSSVQFSCSVVDRLPCPSPTPKAYSNSCLLSQWSHPTLSSSVIPFTSHLQSFPASGFFPMSKFSTSGGQSTGVSALASVLPMDIQDWFPLAWTSWISLLSKGLSRVFSNTTVQNHQFFGTQLSL